MGRKQAQIFRILGVLFYFSSLQGSLAREIKFFPNQVVELRDTQNEQCAVLTMLLYRGLVGENTSINTGLVWTGECRNGKAHGSGMLRLFWSSPETRTPKALIWETSYSLADGIMLREGIPTIARQISARKGIDQVLGDACGTGFVSLPRASRDFFNPDFVLQYAERAVRELHEQCRLAGLRIESVGVRMEFRHGSEMIAWAVRDWNGLSVIMPRFQARFQSARDNFLEALRRDRRNLPGIQARERQQRQAQLAQQERQRQEQNRRRAQADFDAMMDRILTSPLTWLAWALLVPICAFYGLSTGIGKYLHAGMQTAIQQGARRAVIWIVGGIITPLSFWNYVTPGVWGGRTFWLFLWWFLVIGYGLWFALSLINFIKGFPTALTLVFTRHPAQDAVRNPDSSPEEFTKTMRSARSPEPKFWEHFIPKSVYDLKRYRSERLAEQVDDETELAMKMANRARARASQRDAEDKNDV